VEPRQFRRLLGVQGRGPAARRDTLNIAKQEVADFPVINMKSGVMSDETLLMSDAWATAKFVQRNERLMACHGDPAFMTALRRKVFASSKDLRRGSKSVQSFAQNARAGSAADVMARGGAFDQRVDRLLEKELQGMLDEELLQRREARENAVVSIDRDAQVDDGDDWRWYS